MVGFTAIPQSVVIPCESLPHPPISMPPGEYTHTLPFPTVTNACPVELNAIDCGPWTEKCGIPPHWVTNDPSGAKTWTVVVPMSPTNAYPEALTAIP